MEAIILEFKDKSIKVKNVDSGKITYFTGDQKGLKEGDVLRINVEKSHRYNNLSFIHGKFEKLNDTDYYFDECIKCGEAYNSPSKPLCRKCWKELKIGKKTSKEVKEKERVFKKDSTLTRADEVYQDFRQKYPANYRALDGHWVRSKSEKIVDDILFRNKILHIYERKIPSEDMLKDFYLPDYKIWIEYWGRDTKEYNIRKEEKVELYKKHGYDDRLIELTEDDIGSIDDVLEERLLKLGVKLNLE